MFVVEVLDPTPKKLQPLGPEFDVETHGVKTRSDIMFTSGVFTCIALAAYNPRTKRGMLGHFSSITPPGQFSHLHSDNTSFKTAVNNIRWLGDPASTRIWLGGGAPSFEDGVDTVAADRTYAEERVQRFADRYDLTNPRVTTNWVGEQRYLNMALNCDLGVLAIENMPALEVA